MSDRNRWMYRGALRMRRVKWVRAGVISILLLAAFAQMLYTARHTSQTIDEGLHITSGATMLRSGDYRLVEEHPPLLKLWMALPLLPLDLGDFTAFPAWEEAAIPTAESLPLLTLTQQWLYPYTPQERVIFAARGMNALWGVLLLALIARWSRDLWGGGGLLAVACAAFDPNLIAHGAVAGTDLGAACFILAGAWAGARFLRRPTRERAALAGGLLGLALAAKLTAALLGPPLALAGLLRLWRSPRDQRGKLIGHTLLLLGMTALALWAVYGFEVGHAPGLAAPIPAPSHAIPWMRLLEHSAGGHQAYLLGRNSHFGWPHYFPVAFLIKTPLPLLLLIGLRIINGKKRMANGEWRIPNSKFQIPNSKFDVSRLTLSAFPLFYLLISLTSSLNIGYRHLLPVLPFLYVGMGNLEWGMGKKKRRAGVAARPLTPHAVLITGILIWLAVGTLAILPYPLSYFNELVGGPEEGWRYLADSNTDWGQGYKALAAFQADNALGPVQLAAFVFFDPAIYGVDYTPLTPLGGDTPAIFPARFAPPPGEYVISATPLNGIPTADPEMYDWFRWRAPDAKIAHALFYYRVTPEETATAWLAQCAAPVAPLDAEAVAEGFGAVPARHLLFDCARAWVIPAGSAPGVYALHGQWLRERLPDLLHLAPPQATDTFLERRLAGTDISYRQRAYRDQPAFALYRQANAPHPPPTAAWIAPAGTVPAALASQPARTGEIALQGPLAFLGAAAHVASDGLEVETWWRVTGSAEGRSLSLMAHLLTEDGVTLGNADGLAFSPEQWRVGDVFAQRHAFPLPPEGAPGRYWLQTGAYWLDTLERWQISAAGDGILFGEIDVRP